MLRRGESFIGKSINISGCFDLTSFEPFKGAKVVIADGLQIADLSPLADCQRVSLRYNEAVRDLTPLTNVSVLDISFTKVEDITPLWGVRFLTMDCCPLVSQKSLDELLKEWDGIIKKNNAEISSLLNYQQGRLTLGNLKDFQENKMGMFRFIRCGFNPHLERPYWIRNDPIIIYIH